MTQVVLDWCQGAKGAQGKEIVLKQIHETLNDSKYWNVKTKTNTPQYLKVNIISEMPLMDWYIL